MIVFRRINNGCIIAALSIALIFQWQSIRALKLPTKTALLLKSDIGTGYFWRGKSGNCHLGLLAAFGNVFDDAKVERIAKTGRDAGGFQSDFEAINAHIALLDMPLYRVELRCVIWADPGAITATETNFRVLQYSAIFGKFCVGPGRAALEADRIIAMIAGHGNIQACEVRIAAALNISYRAVRDMVFIPFHFFDCVNRLTLGLLDPHSRQPAYKQSAVRIEPVDQDEAARMNFENRTY